MVSIIIPVYNTQIKYLNECISSVLEQTYSEIEIIIVDDGSNKEIATHLEKYTEIDTRVKVIHVQNGGVSRARNIGIENSKGEYVCFVDSDDVLDKNYIKIAMKEFESDVDLVIGKIAWISESDFIKTNFSENQNWKNVIQQTETATVEDNIIKFLSWSKNEDEFFSGYRPEVWGKIYKKNIVKNIKFDEEIQIGEDVLFFIKYYIQCKRIVIINHIAYSYRVYTDSAMHKFDEKRLSKYISYMEKFTEVCNENDMFAIIPLKIYFMMKELAGCYIDVEQEKLKNYKAAQDSVKAFYANSIVKKQLTRLNVYYPYVSYWDKMLFSKGINTEILKIKYREIKSKVKSIIKENKV